MNPPADTPPVLLHEPPIALLDPARLNDQAAEAVSAFFHEGQSANTARTYKTALQYWGAWHALRYGRALSRPGGGQRRGAVHRRSPRARSQSRGARGHTVLAHRGHHPASVAAGHRSTAGRTSLQGEDGSAGAWPRSRRDWRRCPRRTRSTESTTRTWASGPMPIRCAIPRFDCSSVPPGGPTPAAVAGPPSPWPPRVG